MWDIPLITDDRVRFRFFGELENKKITVCIEVDEYTRFDELQNSLWAALRWRDKLSIINGPQGSILFYQGLSEHQHRGVSYRQLAMDINQALAENLRAYADFLTAVETVLPKFFTIGDFWRWFGESGYTHGNPSGFEHADSMLQLVQPGATEAKRHEFLLAGLENIRAGRLPWDDAEYPVSSDDVRNRIKQYRKYHKHDTEGV